MKRAYAENILLNLWIIKREVAQGKYPTYGICARMDDLQLGFSPFATYCGSANEAWDWVKCEVMARWPEFSGDDAYPVLGGKWAYCAAEELGGGKHFWTGAYGGARIRLLNFLIRTFGREIAEGLHCES